MPMALRICLSVLSLFFIYACETTIDPASRNDITIINSFNQEVTITLYESMFTFKVKPGKSYTYNQGLGDGPPPLDFNGSDSIIVTFADGKKKTDYNCNDMAVTSIIQNCRADTISLFNSFRYISQELSKHNVMNYYTITQEDYNEAK